MTDHASLATQTPRGRPRSPTTLLYVVGVISALSFVVQAGFAPLRGSEGRYAEAARAMAESDTLRQWIAPLWRGQVHVTKPPLAYWPQAVSIRVFGPTEFAVRLPAALSVIALAVLTAFWAAYGPANHRRPTRRRRLAAFAGAMMLSTPLVQAVGRMGITDAPFALCWTAALVAGHAAARAVLPTQRKHARRALWTCIALAVLIKGHAGLLPVAILVGWLWRAGDSTGLRRLKIPIGLPLAVVPLIAWAIAVAQLEPQAWQIWKDQTFGRLTAEADHAQAWWFFLPVALAGLFPATGMLHLAAWSRREQLRREGYLQHDQRASIEGLGAWAVFLPLVVFSIQSGKLMSYLLPLAPPAAVLASLALGRWLEYAKSPDAPSLPPRSPIASLALGTAAAAIAVVLGAGLYFGAWLGPSATALACAPAIIAVLALVRPRNPWSMGVALAGMTALGPAFAGLETRVYESPAPRVARDAQQQVELERPQVGLVGFDLPGLGFYTGAPAGRVDPRFPRDTWQAMRKDNLVLYAEPDAWSQFNQEPFNLLQRRYQAIGELELTTHDGPKRFDVYRPRRRDLQPDRQGPNRMPIPR
ncbi:MAG: glycosyltransferase family 39 protein [Planctomycetota bacterium]